MLLFYKCCWLYTWQLYIAVNFQVVKSHSPEKKLIHISQGFYIFRIFFSFFFHFRFLWQIPVYLVGYAKQMLYSELPTVFLARALHEKCPNTEFFLVRIFVYSGWTQTRNNSVSGHFSHSGRHLNTILLTNLKNSNSILSIFPETYNLLVLTDPVLICIYLRTTDRHFCDQGSIHHTNASY